MACHITYNAVCLVGICRHEYGKAKEVLHEAYIVYALVGGAVLAHIEPVMGGDYLQVGLVLVT